MVSKEEICSWFSNKTEKENFPITDKNDFAELRRLCMEEFKLGRGHYGWINKIFSEMLKEKNFVVVGLNPSTEVGNLQINVPPPPNKEVIVASDPESIDALKDLPEPGEMQITEQPRPPLDISVLKANQETLKEGFKFIGDIYAGLGIIKGNSSIMKIQDMTTEQFNKESDKFAERFGSFLYRRNIPVPWVIELTSLLATAVLLFVIPAVRRFLMTSEESKPEKVAS